MKTLVSKNLPFFFTLRLSFKTWTFACASCYSAILHTERPPCNSHIAARNMHYLRTAEGSKTVSRYHI